MKTLLAKNFLIALCVIAAIGCENNPVTPIESPAPAQPTNLTATAVNQTTVRLNWAASTTSLDSLSSYILSVSGKSDTTIISKTTSTYDVTGLVKATAYTFTLWTKGQNGKLSIPVSVQGLTLGDTITPPAPPTNLMANSKDLQSVNLKWTASASASAADFSAYELVVTPANGTAMAPITIAKGATKYTVAGLTEGTVYSFSLRSKSAATTNNMSNAVVVQWSPATRYSGIRLYETASSQFGAGIDLSTGEVLKFSSAANWDIALDTRVINGVVDDALGAPSLLTYNISNPRNTLISAKIITNASSLDDVFETDVLGAGGMKPDSARYIHIAEFSGSFVFFAKTIDGNFAKILVKSTNGKLLQGTAPNRYVELDISYQSAANVPYAFVRGGNSPWTFETKSISSSKKIAE